MKVNMEAAWKLLHKAVNFSALVAIGMWIRMFFKNSKDKMIAFINLLTLTSLIGSFLTNNYEEIGEGLHDLFLSED